jgi:hypothetical protein
MSIEWHFWISKIQRIGPSQNARCVESTCEEHKLNVGSYVNHVKCQGTTASSHQAFAEHTFLAFTLRAIQIVWIIAHVLRLQFSLAYILFYKSILFITNAFFISISQTKSAIQNQIAKNKPFGCAFF